MLGSQAESQCSVGMFGGTFCHGTGSANGFQDLADGFCRGGSRTGWEKGRGSSIGAQANTNVL
jgi:hypothetical protein